MIRIKHWIKNLLIYAPLLFGGYVFDKSLFLRSTLAFFAFCFSSSFIYIINDWRDRKVDREHPIKKKQRPIAQGKVKKNTAAATSLILFLAAAVCLGMLQSLFTTLAITLYILLNLAYTFFLKKLPWVDLLIVVSGFVLRLYAGSFATGIELSGWIISLLTLLSCYLITSKRYGEAVAYKQSKIISRQNIRHYHTKTLNVCLWALSLVIATVYFLYSISPEMLAKNHLFWITNLFVASGLFRYNYILFFKKETLDPTDFFWKDTFSQLCILGWTLTCYIMLY